MTIHVTEKPHAKLGPSGWATWGTCSGAPVLSDGVPRKSSKYADEGTAAHAVLEEALANGKDAEEYLGEDVIVDGTAWIVDNEMADAVNSSIDIVKSYVRDPGDVVQVEQTVPLAFMTGEEGAEGTSDVALITEKGTHLHIFDFKYGRGVQVYASEKGSIATRDGDLIEVPNGQLAMYALGWLAKHGFLYEDVEKVTLHVLQPRLEWHDQHTLSVVDLRNFEDVVRDAAGRVELNRQAHLEGGADLDLVPSEKGCKFCAAKAFCPALKNEVSTALATIARPSDPAAFENLTLPKKAAAIEVNEGATNEQLAEFMRAIPLIESAIKGVQAEVERRLFDGQDVPGFYLGQGRKGNRQWANEEEALQELTKGGRLKMSEALARKPISPTKAEKLLKDRPKVWAKIAPQITQPPGKPSVCREGVDKNDRYQIASAVEEFENLDAAAPIPTLDSVLD